MKVLQVVTLASLMVAAGICEPAAPPFQYATYSSPYQNSFSLATPTYRQSFTTKLHNRVIPIGAAAGVQQQQQQVQPQQPQLVPQSYSFVPSQFGVPQNVNPYQSQHPSAGFTPQAANPGFSYNTLYRNNIQPAQYPQNGFFNVQQQHPQQQYPQQHPQQQYPQQQYPQQQYPQQPAVVYPQQTQQGAASGYTPSVVVDFNRNAAGNSRSLNGLNAQYSIRGQPDDVDINTASFDSFKPLFIASAPDKLQDAVDAGSRGRNQLGVSYSPADKVSHFKFERGNLKYNF